MADHTALKIRHILAHVCAGAVLTLGLGLAPSFGLTEPSTFNSVKGLDTQFPRFEVLDVAATLSEMGVAARVMTMDDGSVIIRAETNAQFKFVIYLAACETPPRAACAGMELDAFFDEASAGATLSSVNAFNQSHAFTKAFMLDSGQPILSRYEISDYGITKGNLVSNVVNFVRIGEAFMVHLTEEPLIASNALNDGAHSLARAVSMGAWRANMQANSPNDFNEAQAQPALMISRTFVRGLIENSKTSQEYVNQVGEIKP